jgi:hypothetical protein
MAEIVYKSLTTLAPIELKYEYYKNESLQASIKTYNNGLSLYEVDGFLNYRDIAINKESCFILTSSVNLSTVFAGQERLTIGKTPVSILIAPRLTLGIAPVHFAKYIEEQSTFKLTLTSGSTFYLQPVNNTRNLVEMFVEGKYVQVDELYPYTVRLGERPFTDPDTIGRQQFEVVFNEKENFITFKTLTNDGYRYLTFNDDNIMRATGLMLNESLINDYILQFVPVTNKDLYYGFKPTNNWVTYYFDIENQRDNKNLVINKDFYPVQTNFLVDFPIEEAAATGKVTINIANLKTSVTPAGGPAPVNNAYAKEIINL